jgi:hypothetical protein
MVLLPAIFAGQSTLGLLFRVPYLIVRIKSKYCLKYGTSQPCMVDNIVWLVNG